MDLVDAPADLATRAASTRLVGEPTPYQQYLDDMRATIFRLLSMRTYPIGTRLFLVAYLGKQTAAFFNKGAAEVDETRLADVIEHVGEPGNVALWHQELTKMPAPDVVAAKLVTHMLRERLKVPMGSFRVLIEEILGTYSDVASTNVDHTGAASLSVTDLWTAYSTRRQRWLEVLAGRIDLYFENYAKNFWMREWYVTSTDLLAHSQRLLVRVAMLRFLLFGHPWLQAAEGFDDLDARREALDRAAVDVFYKFSRGIEHEGTFLELIAASLVEQDMNTFAHATVLALV
jgi:lysine-N-methylase